MIQLTIDPALSAAGIKVHAVHCSVPRVARKRGGPLKKHIETILAQLNIEELLRSPILTESKKFYAPLGTIPAMPPAEHLLHIIKKSQMLPNINNVVDCYNIVSAQTLLALGAHDLKHISGNLHFKYTTGTERYIPLGGSAAEKVFPGEYACMDDEKIICRMDIKQCDETKVGLETTDFIVYCQGNAATDDEYVRDGLSAVCKNIEQFCGGSFTVLP